MRSEQIEQALAYVAVGMPVLIGTLRAARRGTERLRAYVAMTPEKWDDRMLARLVRALDAADAVIDVVSYFIPSPPARRARTENAP